MSDAEARRRLRSLARAVVEMRRCHKSPSGPCAIITEDDHVRDVYKLAEQAMRYLDTPDRRPS